jgi:hypothetical protein
MFLCAFENSILPALKPLTVKEKIDSGQEGQDENDFLKKNNLSVTGYSAQSRPPIPQQTGPPKLNFLLKESLCYFSLIQI